MKLGKTSRIGLILSFIFVGSCAAGLDPFPARHMYVSDQTNRVCVKYKITDSEKVTLEWVSEAPLAPKGDCDRLVGFHRNEFKSVHNWVRDAIKELKKMAAQIAELINA